MAEALESANGDRVEDVAPLLVRHFGEAGEDEATLRYAVIAGDAAARLYANAEAEAQYRTALDAARRVGAEPSLLRSVYERRGTALELAGRYDDVIANYEEMRSVAREVGDEAMELGADTAFALLYSTATPRFDPELGRRLSKQNVATARRLGDRAAEARSLWNILVANVYGSGDHVEAIAAGEASLEISRTLGDREQIAFTLNDLWRAHMANEDLATASLRLEEGRQLWEELGNRPMLSENLVLASCTHLLAGDLDLALADARSALSIAESIDNAWGQSFALIFVYRVQLHRGDFAAIGSMHRSLELGEGGGFAFASIGPRADLARTLAYLGDVEAAIPFAERALEIAMEKIPSARSIVQVALAETFLAGGDHVAARAALEGLEIQLPEPDLTLARVGADLAHARAALAAGDPAQAATWAAGALEYLGSRRIPILVAEALVELASARIAEGRLDEAERHLDEAIHGSQRLGERRALYDALALMAQIRDRSGRPDEGEELRRRARGVAEEMAASVSDEALRDRFLARHRGV